MKLKLFIISIFIFLCLSCEKLSSGTVVGKSHRDAYSYTTMIWHSMGKSGGFFTPP